MIPSHLPRVLIHIITCSATFCICLLVYIAITYPIHVTPSKNYLTNVHEVPASVIQPKQLYCTNVIAKLKVDIE